MKLQKISTNGEGLVMPDSGPYILALTEKALKPIEYPVHAVDAENFFQVVHTIMNILWKGLVPFERSNGATTPFLHRMNHLLASLFNSEFWLNIPTNLRIKQADHVYKLREVTTAFGAPPSRSGLRKVILYTGMSGTELKYLNDLYVIYPSQRDLNDFGI
jgi:hypothetical protein